MSMNAERDNLDAILSELAATRARERELLLRMTALLEAQAPGVPQHVISIFAHAKELQSRRRCDGGHQDRSHLRHRR